MPRYQSLELLAAPLSPDWTIEGLAEQLLCAIADDNRRMRLKSRNWCLMPLAARTDNLAACSDRCSHASPQNRQQRPARP
jgi:hypothetical protein